MVRRAPAGRWAIAIACLGLVLPSACRSGAAPAGGFPGLAQILEEGETPLLVRGLPLERGSGLIAVVRLADGREELRVAEAESARYAVRGTSRAGDEFRNLTVEDVNADGRIEIVSRWAGGQLDVVEVLARDAGGAWKPILQNAGQAVEERRRPDRSIGFWITSRTYEEGPGLPPVYETRVWRWDGAAFTEEPPAP